MQLLRCDAFNECLELSPASVGSMRVKREILYALQQARYENKIVPVIYKDCDPDQLSWVLGSFQMIDCKHDFDDSSRELLKIWGYGYKPA